MNFSVLLKKILWVLSDCTVFYLAFDWRRWYDSATFSREIIYLPDLSENRCWELATMQGSRCGKWFIAGTILQRFNSTWPCTVRGLLVLKKCHTCASTKVYSFVACCKACPDFESMLGNLHKCMNVCNKKNKYTKRVAEGHQIFIFSQLYFICR